MSEGMEAIVLAGGLGTRLREFVHDLPKPMAPVAGKPFLHYTLESLDRQGFSRVVLSVGYKFERIKGHFGNHFGGMKLDYVVEEEPLGTGGGIRLAFYETTAQDVLVLNGDTYFGVDFVEMARQHQGSAAMITCALKPMRDFDRYGTVDTDPQGRITAFNEKMPRQEGLINGGVYWIRSSLWEQVAPAHKFSFEKDILERYLGEIKVQGYVSDAYFIDIGIPQDYLRAQDEMPNVQQ